MRVAPMIVAEGHDSVRHGQAPGQAEELARLRHVRLVALGNG
jgi:hypothetical protein